MTEPKLISPMLDHFAMGDPISDHHGVRCCPAMKMDSEDKYIVKIISIPASQTQLDALLLTGAYPDEASALTYFKELADGVTEEVQILSRLSQLEGFLPYENLQIVPMENETGYEVYLLSTYKRALDRHFSRNPMTHLGAINLGLDLCAALAVCRRSGYLYVDLKPSNVFVTEEQEYRIGDIGFVRLDSLKYASLPEKYRSVYTAPEISDAFSSLNPTMDVYAAGLILYQAYNNGTLPFIGESAPAEGLNPPMYADYEMAEIILKACAPDPKDRWQDPIQMGQALVSYMQRNGANDMPIVPPPVTVKPEAEVDTEPNPEDVVSSDLEASSLDIPTEAASPEEAVENTEPVILDEENQTDDLPTSAELIYKEDNDGNLTFLSELVNDETAPGQDDSHIPYDEVSDEVSQILTQADELVSHPVPDPVVAPDPVELPIPEPFPITSNDSEQTVPEETESTLETNTPDAPNEAEETDISNTESPDNTQVTKPAKKKPSRLWLAISLAMLFILALLAGGFYYYTNFYLQSIESVTVEGHEDGLTVYVSSTIDESKLSVVCSNAYGTQIVAPVSDGKAVFENLIPDTGYNVYVQIEGFHKLIGQTSTAYSTPVQTTIVQFSAITGSEDGSVILGFTIDGQDANQWKVVYAAEGEEERSATFPSHTVTLSGLTVGKEYTFTLVPDTDLYLTGTEQITYTASKLVYAQNLRVIGCMDRKLTANWSAPDDTVVENWTVRCYNSNGYNETIITTETSAVFENLDHRDSFTIEVTAGGMTVSQRVYVPANSVTVTDFKAGTSDYQTLMLSWNTSQDVPKEGWILQYAIEGTPGVWSVICKENSAKLSPVLPGSTYIFTLQSPDGVPFLSEPLLCVVPVPPNFSGTFGGLNVSREDLIFSMCKTPNKKDWTYKDLKDTDYTTTFTVGQKASFLVKLNTSYGTSETDIDILYIIRDAEGNPVSSSLQTYRWCDMWNKYYCELDIPSLPSVAGNYTINVYFNGAQAAEQDFTVIA